MKSVNLEAEVLRACTKISNLRKSLAEMENKAARLEVETEKIRKSILKESDIFRTFGEKTSRRDGKPETQEETLRKLEYNSNLRKQKLELIKKRFPDGYAKFESLLPDPLKDENLD